MRVLVLSRRHALLPYAHRLSREGVTVSTVVWQHDYEAAWEGLVQKALRGSRGDLTRERLAGLAEGATVLTDVPEGRSLFPEGTTVFDTLPASESMSSLRLGAWFDGEAWSLRHLVIVDVGAWQGGLGPQIPGSATLVRIDRPEALELFDQLAAGTRDALKSAGFRGLVSMGLELGGVAEVTGFEAGWPLLVTQAFLSELEGLGSLLAGGEARLASRYVCVVPVSVPPWPSAGSAPSRPIAGLTPQQQGRVFWHDVAADPLARSLRTAGLNGLVGVARGAAESLALAQGRALEIALRLRLDEKQFRPDAGGTVAQDLAALENGWNVVL